MVATPPDTPASTVKTEPILPAVATLGYAGLPYAAGLPYTGLPYAGLAYPGYAGLPYLGRKRRDADADASVLLANGAPNALPVVTIPEPATTGYAVGASSAIGGQAPVAAMEPVAVAINYQICAFIIFQVSYWHCVKLMSNFTILFYYLS